MAILELYTPPKKKEKTAEEGIPEHSCVKILTNNQRQARGNPYILVIMDASLEPAVSHSCMK